MINTGNSTPPPLGETPPPPGGFASSGWAPEKPSGLALWTIILTGVYTLLAIVAALRVETTLEETKRSIEEQTQYFDPMQSLSFPVMLASFVLLALWMGKVRSNWKARNIEPGGPPAVEWWGWFVPLANFVLPFLGMKAIARRTVSIGLLLGWWIPFCAMWIFSFASAIPSFTAVDFTTGELTDPEALDAMVPLTYAGTAALVVSWIFLALIVRKVTDRHLTAE